MLNRCYLPVHITSVKRAINLLCLDIAHGIDAEYQTYTWDSLFSNPPSDDEIKRDSFYFVRTVHQVVPVPKVVILRGYDKRPPHSVRFSRTQVFLRDSHTCQYCGEALPKPRLNIDHVVPRIQGGKTTWENVVTSCHHCNRVKGGRTPQQAGMRLLSLPRKPRESPQLSLLKKIHTSWLPFFATTD